MKITNNYTTNFNVAKTPYITSFKAVPVETIKHYNIGIMENGVIGKIKVLTKDGKETFLNVIKDADGHGNESYLIKDAFGKIIGEMDIRINKFYDYDRINFPEDPSHVFVEFLCNHSKPATNYDDPSLQEYKYIGTRLLQIAQRRSDETGCLGNIRLSSRKDATEYYKKLGFKEEFFSYMGLSSNMYLPPDSKEPLSRMYGGL